MTSIAFSASAVIVLAAGRAFADGSSTGAQAAQGDSGGSQQSGDGGDTQGVHGVLQCVTANVGADGTPTSYTAVWGFSGVPNGSYKVPGGWRNDVSGGSGAPPGSVTGESDSHKVVGTWTSKFTGGSAMWHFGSETIQADTTSAPCSPAPQVPEVPAAVVAPVLVAAGLGAGLVMRRRHHPVA